MKNLIKKSLVVLALMLSFSSINFAQNDDPILKACEETADKLKEASIKNQGLENEVKLLKELITLKDEKISVVTEQKDFYKKAYDNSTKIDTNATLIIENLRVQVNDYRRETTDLRRENDKLRDSRSWRTYFGFAAGFGAGYLVKSNQ